jgi:hypothetical protein
MAHLQLNKILDSFAGVKRDGAAYLVAEELDANIFIALGQEVLQVTRLSRIEVAADLVTLSNHKGERFYFPPDQVVGLRFGAPDAKASRSSAGFR